MAAAFGLLTRIPGTPLSRAACVLQTLCRRCEWLTAVRHNPKRCHCQLGCHQCPDIPADHLALQQLGTCQMACCQVPMCISMPAAALAARHSLRSCSCQGHVCSLLHSQPNRSFPFSTCTPAPSSSCPLSAATWLSCLTACSPVHGSLAGHLHPVPARQQRHLLRPEAQQHPAGRKWAHQAGRVWALAAPLRHQQNALAAAAVGGCYRVAGLTG